MDDPARPPPLSVIMSVFNAAPYLPAAISSVLDQDFNQFEFLIVDDGSTDDSLKIARSFADRDPRISLFAKPRGGLVPALNFLLGQARSPLVARMDADDISHPQRMSRQVEFLEANPDHGVLGCETDFIDAAGNFIPQSGNRWVLDDPEMKRALADGPPFAHPTVMMRRELVVAAGGYRQAFIHAEDYDLRLRLAPKTKFANLPERLFQYRLHTDQISHAHLPQQAFSAAMAQLAERNRRAGRPDPAEGLDRLPSSDDELDRMFGAGSASLVHAKMFESVRHARQHAIGIGWTSTLAHARGSPDRRILRFAARLLLDGRVAASIQLSFAMLQGAALRVWQGMTHQYR